MVRAEPHLETDAGTGLPLYLKPPRDVGPSNDSEARPWVLCLLDIERPRIESESLGAEGKGALACPSSGCPSLGRGRLEAQRCLRRSLLHVPHGAGRNV